MLLLLLLLLDLEAAADARCSANLARGRARSMAQRGDIMLPDDDAVSLSTVPPPPPTPKANADGSISAVSRLLKNRRRKSCVFVNPSDDMLLRLRASASQLQLLLTQNDEENVGSVVRLLRTHEPEVEAPSPVVEEARSARWSKEETEDPADPAKTSTEERADLAENSVTEGLSRPPPLHVQPATSPGCEVLPVPGCEPQTADRITPTPSPVRRSLSDHSPRLFKMVSFTTQAVVNLVQESLSATTERPELTEDGTGGVYLIRSSRALSERISRASSEGEDDSSRSDDLSESSRRNETVAVFKPSVRALEMTGHAVCRGTLRQLRAGRIGRAVTLTLALALGPDPHPRAGRSGRV